MIKKDSIGSPSHEYDSMVRVWRRARAVLGGELAAKQHDRDLDTHMYTNLLVPFSPRMSQGQYSWYVAEAELPGLASQYSRTLLGGLLRKEPSVTYPENLPQAEKAADWIRYKFTESNQSLVSFLDAAIKEELETSRAVVSVDFPVVAEYANLTPEQRANISPYPVLWKAEDVINWQTKIGVTGDRVLSRVVFRFVEQDYSTNPHHPEYVGVIADHYLDENNQYVVDYWKKESPLTVEADMGVAKYSHSVVLPEGDWKKIEERTARPLMHGERLDFIPVFFLNGSIDPVNPILVPLVDKEIALYNKISRRNHLLYGASTYTPVVSGNMTDEAMAAIVDAGLGSWIFLPEEGVIDILKTPTEALVDYDRAIEAGTQDMARLGARILAPESNGAESGIALEIRNSAQTAQLGVLNVRISQTMKEIIKLMLRWKYDADLDVEELDFELSQDFNPAPIGVDWMRMITEWYEGRLIPRSAFIKMAMANDLLPGDYNDEEAHEEIGQDELVPDPVETKMLDHELSMEAMAAKASTPPKKV